MRIFELLISDDKKIVIEYDNEGGSERYYLSIYVPYGNGKWGLDNNAQYLTFNTRKDLFTFLNVSGRAEKLLILT